jgi:hypothetical protein
MQESVLSVLFKIPAASAWNKRLNKFTTMKTSKGRKLRLKRREGWCARPNVAQTVVRAKKTMPRRDSFAFSSSRAARNHFIGWQLIRLLHVFESVATQWVFTTVSWQISFVVVFVGPISGCTLTSSILTLSSQDNPSLTNRCKRGTPTFSYLQNITRITITLGAMWARGVQTSHGYPMLVSRTVERYRKARAGWAWAGCIPRWR